jgi:hypothetical protein
MLYRRQSIQAVRPKPFLSRARGLIVKADERSGASQKALTMRVSGIGREWTDGEDEGKKWKK